MIIQCPSCRKKYNIKAEDIGPTGRFVRCTSCGHEWVAAAEDISGAAVISETTMAATSATAEAKNNAESINSISNIAAIPKTHHDTHSYCSAYSWLSYLCTFYIFCITLFSIMLSIHIWNTEIKKKFPYSGVVYRKLGLDDISSLKITNVTISSSKNETHVAASLKLNILNEAASIKRLPKIRFIAYDAHMLQLGEIIIQVDTDIAPKERKIIDGNLTNLPLGTTYVSADIGNIADLRLRDIHEIHQYIQ